MDSKSGKKGSKSSVSIAEVVEVYLDQFAEEAEKKPRGGLFGIDDLAEAKARRSKLDIIKEELEKHNKGYEGVKRTCPKCGTKTQIYKGDRNKNLVFDCGKIAVKRAYYRCEKCGTSSFPLDEKLNIQPSPEQGRLRQKMSMLGVICPYNKSREVCETLLGSFKHAATMRRVTLDESEIYAEQSPQKELPTEKDNILYIGIDGHMCPTRDERKDAEDQGYREAKMAQAFLDTARVVPITLDEKPPRAALTEQLLLAKVCSATEFTPLVRKLYYRAKGWKTELVVFLGDGATWIWKLAKDICLKGIHILDYAHAKQRLWEFVKIIREHEPHLQKPLVDEFQELLFEDKVDVVIERFRNYADLDEKIADAVTYFENNRNRMMYGTFRKKGYLIGSGSIESAGKRLSQGRIKGCGMRWNVKDLNPLLHFRCGFMDNTWDLHWKQQRNLDDYCAQKLAA